MSAFACGGLVGLAIFIALVVVVSAARRAGE